MGMSSVAAYFVQMIKHARRALRVSLLGGGIFRPFGPWRQVYAVKQFMYGCAIISSLAGRVMRRSKATDIAILHMAV